MPACLGLLKLVPERDAPALAHQQRDDEARDRRRHQVHGDGGGAARRLAQGRGDGGGERAAQDRAEGVGNGGAGGTDGGGEELGVERADLSVGCLL